MATGAVSHYWPEACFERGAPRSTFSMIDSALAVQAKGLGSALCLSR